MEYGIKHIKCRECFCAVTLLHSIVFCIILEIRLIFDWSTALSAFQWKCKMFNYKVNVLECFIYVHNVPEISW